MIHASELRIGNFVNIIGVVPIQIDAQRILSISNGDDDYEPIKITEEFLTKKFVFEKIVSEKYDLYGGPFYSKEDYDIFSSGSSWYFVICNYMDNPPTVKIEYIHQLQNIYFALKQKELELK